MRYFSILLVFFIFCAGESSAQWHRQRRPHWPKTEGALVNRLLRCLQDKDTTAYVSLFPPFDTLWHMVMHNPDKSPDVTKELNSLRERPQALIEFDPRYNYSIIGRFCKVLAKGEDSGLRWNSVVMARYQLVKQEPSRSLIGYDKIAPERFMGYLFVSDPYNRTIYCITITEIQKIKGNFFGGQVMNVLEAKTIDEFHLKEERERLYMEWVAAHPDSVAILNKAKADSVAANDSGAADDPLLLIRETDDDDDDWARREVADRKYYEGLLDSEILVRLYVRDIKTVPGKPMLYDGLYKLGENKRYLKLDIARKPDGKWIFEDESAIGTMELMLNGKTYSGQWTNAEENGYDVVLTQTSMPKGKMELLDKILDRGANPRIDEDRFETDKQDKPRKERKSRRGKKRRKGEDKEARAKVKEPDNKKDQGAKGKKREMD